MHLSLLSDGYLSDSLADAVPFATSGQGRAHRDGLLRGLLFLAALSLPFALTIASAPADGPGAASPMPVTTGLRVTHLQWR